MRRSDAPSCVGRGGRAGRAAVATAAAVLAALVAGCSGSGSTAAVDGPGSGVGPSGSGTGSPSTDPAARPSAAAALSRYTKVMVIAMENKTEGQVLDHPDAPVLTGLAARFGRPTRLDAGYPPKCPSLAAYLLLTSGSTHDVCDDKNPSAHPISGDNLFAQVAASGRQYRNYAESMPENCYPKNSRDFLYVVRHAPAGYYVSERARCRDWQIPLGSLTAGALHDDLTAGTLPAYSFVTPNNCNNMHSTPRCPRRSVQIGDTWIGGWVRQILASPDYTAGRLAVFITWDEGTKQDNHIPAVVISPTTLAARSATAYTQCSMVRSIQEILRVPLLGCAAQAPSMLAEFKLGL